MKLGLIAEHSDPARGGAERFAADLAERARLHGHQVVMASRTGPAARPVRSTPSMLRPRFYADRFLPALRDEGAERVLTFAPIPGCDFFQPRMGLLQAAIPPHYDAIPQPWQAVRRFNPIRRLHLRVLRGFESEALSPPSVLLTHSPRVLADAERFYPGIRPTLIRTGVDLERFHPGVTAPDRPTLLFVAHNFELKGLETCLRTLALLEGVELQVVGNGKRKRFARLAAQLGVADRVQWRGADPELDSLCRMADVLVHPTFYDAAARVVLEALASGTPPITTTRDGNADLAARGGAVLEDPADHARLAVLVREQLSIDRGERASRARAVAEEFPADALLDKMVEVLTS
jgi:UDP-glucose:(heptosyl)LPS alpha-1,3-glucosyltransferase